MTMTIQELKNRGFGFIRDHELKNIVQENEFEPMLVRCGSCRFTAPAQDVAHLISMIERDNQDYVRDVSFVTA